MTVFTVVAAHKTKDVEGQYGPMKDLALTLRDGQDIEHQASWFTKQTTPVPEIGSTIEGELEPGRFGLKFKKAGGFAGGGGGFARAPQDDHPVRRAGIVRQHSEDMALKTIELGLTLGIVKAPENTEQLRVLIRKWAAWYDEDVREAREAAK